MVNLKGEMIETFAGVIVKLEALAIVDFRRGVELNPAAVDLLVAGITNVKRGIRNQIHLRTKEFKSTRDVLLDTTREGLETLDFTRSSLSFTKKQATDWLLKTVRLP